MKAWQRGFLHVLVLNAAVRCVTSLEEELADSIFGEFPVKTCTWTCFFVAKVVFSWLWDVCLSRDESIWMVNHWNTKTQTIIQIRLLYSPTYRSLSPLQWSICLYFLCASPPPTPEQNIPLLIRISWLHKGMKNWRDYSLEVAATKLWISMDLCLTKWTPVTPENYTFSRWEPVHRAAPRGASLLASPTQPEH